MNDQHKSKEELIAELHLLRQEVCRLEMAHHQHKAVQDALKESEYRYRTLIGNIPDFIFSINHAGAITDFNIPPTGLAGWTGEDLIGQEFIRLIHPEDRERVGRTFLKMVGHRREWARGLCFRVQTKTGEHRWMELNAHYSYDSQGRFLRLEGVLRNITKRRSAEQSIKDNLYFLESLDRVNRIIRKSEDLEALMKNVLEKVLSIFDCDRAWLLYPGDPKAPYWSIPMECTRPEYPGASANGELIPMTPPFAAIIQAVLASDEPCVLDNNPIGLEWDREDRFQIRSLAAMALFPKTGAPWGFGLHQCSRNRRWTRDELHLFKEIGRRLGDALSSLLFLRNLKESEEKYRLLVENANDAIFITQDGWLKFMNRKTTDLFGCSADELDDAYLVDLIHPDDRGPAGKWEDMQYLPETETGHRSFRMTNCDDEQIWVQWSVVAISWQNQPAFLNFLHDITSEKRLESQLHQSRKMEAIGTLAGGIAHDFNNILQAISGYVQLFQVKNHIDAQSARYLAEVDRAVERASDLIQRLLTFSRKVEPHFRTVELNQLVSQTVKILERIIPKMIQMDTQLTEPIHKIKADPVQIERILINLGANARDAMPGGGRLIIETENAYLGELYCKTQVSVKPGDYVLLRVADTGHGMDRKTVARIFDPFFTTKAMGRGTGLGLSTVYGIVKNHGGHITCHSEPGQGTLINIYFPVATDGEGLENVPEKRYDAGIFNGGETILLVDDEHPILEAVRESLEVHGYQVLTAASGEEALDIFQKQGPQIDLVIMDLVMPGMGGHGCLEELLKQEPDLKVIISSGYSTRRHLNASRQLGAKGFIGKPYRLLDLLQKIRDVLD